MVDDLGDIQRGGAVNILLIRPNESLHGPGHIFAHYQTFKFLGSKALMPPLELATLAALTPPDNDIRIWDEAVDGEISLSSDFDKRCDIIGITGYIHHLKRIKELVPLLRRLQPSATIVGGGSGLSASSDPEVFSLDVIFIGEAEVTWPRFLSDYRNGKVLHRYEQVQPIDMELSPAPAWHLIPNVASRYLAGPVQTTRGCPFPCEFCDVASLFGRKPRHKAIDRVLSELKLLHELGFDHVVFCDDNFYGDRKYTRNLLRELISQNKRFKNPPLLACEISIDIAQNEPTLALLAEANFNSLFIGIESPNKETLVEANKPQNYRTDMISDIKKIQSYGIPVRAGIIVGFDHDDERIFRQQKQFLEDACISTQAVNILEALPNTQLWNRLQREGRITAGPALVSHSWSHTNIIPKQMTLDRLVSGYHDLILDLARWESFDTRMRGMMGCVSRRPEAKLRVSSAHQLLQFFWFVLFGTDSMARSTILALFAHALWRAPFMLQVVAEQILYHIAFTREAEALCGVVPGKGRGSLAGAEYDVGRDAKQLPRTAA